MHASSWHMHFHGLVIGIAPSIPALLCTAVTNWLCHWLCEAIQAKLKPRLGLARGQVEIEGATLLGLQRFVVARLPWGPVHVLHAQAVQTRLLAEGLKAAVRRRLKQSYSQEYVPPPYTVKPVCSGHPLGPGCTRG